MCGFIIKGNKSFIAGESKEILTHGKKGINWDITATSIPHGHAGFVNQMVLSPDGSKFITVGADKQIILWDTEKCEKLKNYAGAHAMGIYDADWIDDKTFITCSADNNVKKWSIEEDAAI